MTDLTLPDHKYLTVKELADLLRLKERKIYDLASSGSIPCSKATGKLLFPAAEIEAWVADAKSGGRTATIHPSASRPPIVLGSHDPLLDWAIRQSQCGLATFYDGSMDGLQRFAEGQGLAAGIHIHDAVTDTWNEPAVTQALRGQNAVLISFVKRRRGLVFPPGGKALSDLSDLSGLKFVPRQSGSGTDGLFHAMAEKQGLDLSKLTFSEVARTEDEAVERVRRGLADATFGLEVVARNYGLEFLPLTVESFDLLVDRKAWFDGPFQTLIKFFKTSTFIERANDYGGYDIKTCGNVVWNA